MPKHASEEAVNSKQPASSDLTAIAALATTEFGRGLLELADGTEFASRIPNGTFVPADPALAIVYNADGTVQSVTENGIATTYTYNADGTVATSTRLGVTRTYGYTSGNLTSVA